MKRFFAGACALFLTASISVCAFATPSTFSQKRVLTPPIWMPNDILLDNENLPVPTDSSMKSQNEMGYTEIIGNEQKFTSLVDGYSVLLPQNMSVDMSLSDVGAYFTDGHMALRILKESFNTASERASYLEYSNRFIQNNVNHRLENEQTYTIGDRTIRILQWSRSTLSRVSGDKCYYACVDVSIGGRVYTFFFSADTPFTTLYPYMNIVNSLQPFDPAVPKDNAYTKGYKKTDISHLNASAQATYNKLFGSDTDFKLGMFPPDRYGGFSRMEEFERELGYNFCAFLVYTEVPDRHGETGYKYTAKVNNYIEKIEKNLDYARQSGKTIELTLQTPLSRLSESNMIYEILNGEYDQFLNAYGKMIARYKDVTVLFRPFNEMNCDWCNYSAYYTSRDPQLYVELYRYLYNKFKSLGCDNTIWVWNPNEISFPRYKWNSEALYYPGDEYVDVYGLTGYNTGTYYSAEIWRSFDEIYAPIYARAEKINEKPMMLTEFSCSSVGGDKVAWIEDMFNSLSKYDKIKVGIWWHAADYDGSQIARPYFMDTPEGTLDIFKKYLGK